MEKDDEELEETRDYLKNVIRERIYEVQRKRLDFLESCPTTTLEKFKQKQCNLPPGLRELSDKDS